MAVPAFRLLRRAFPGSFIGGLMRPGVAELLAGSFPDGTQLFDEAHIELSRGMMAPKFAAAKIRPRRYDAALIFRNSFSSALIARLAGIPRRLGYAGDARDMLLTESVKPTGRTSGDLPLTPIVSHYHRLAWTLLVEPALLAGSVDAARIERPPANSSGGVSAAQRPIAPTPTGRRDAARLAWPLPKSARLELPISAEQHAAGAALLTRLGITPGERLAILNPGASKEYKRWPADRFAAVADHLSTTLGVRVLVNGAPSEAELAAAIAAGARTPVVSLAAAGITIGALKALLHQRESPVVMMVTGDTGPRHIAGAFRIPRVVLFGSTDPRLTRHPDVDSALEFPVESYPFSASPPAELAEDRVYDDHEEDCRIDRIPMAPVLDAVDACSRSAGLVNKSLGVSVAQASRLCVTPGPIGTGETPVPPSLS